MRVIYINRMCEKYICEVLNHTMFCELLPTHSWAVHRAVYINFYSYVSLYIYLLMNMWYMWVYICMYIRYCSLKSKFHVLISYSRDLFGKCLWGRRERIQKRQGEPSDSDAGVIPGKEEGKDGEKEERLDWQSLGCSRVCRKFQRGQWGVLVPKLPVRRGLASFKNGPALVILSCSVISWE